MVVLLVLLGVCLGFAAPALAGPMVYNVHGRLVYPDGRPAAGAVLSLYPHSGETIDKENVKWKIPNYDFHRVTTDQNGGFVMTNVIDYPENKTHRYVIYCEGPDPFYNAVAHVILFGPDKDLQVPITMTQATVLRLHLKDRQGKPFNGKRAIYVQAGVLGQGAEKGHSFVIDVEFVNGVAERGRIALKEGGQGRVAILDFPEARYALEIMKQHDMALGDNTGPLRWVMKNSRGAALDKSLTFVSAGYTDLDFSL